MTTTQIFTQTLLGECDGNEYEWNPIKFPSYPMPFPFIINYSIWFTYLQINTYNFTEKKSVHSLFVVQNRENFQNWAYRSDFFCFLWMLLRDDSLMVKGLGAHVEDVSSSPGKNVG